jgi:hypothetical protein
VSIVVVSNEKPAAEPAPAKPAEDKVEASSETDKPAPEAKASEQEEVTDSGTETTEAEEKAEESEPTDKVELDAEEGTEEKPKKKSGIQRRVDKLTKRATAAEIRAMAAEQELAVLKQRQALNGAGEPKVETAKPITAEGEPQPETFDDHKSYVKALAKWEAKQLFQEERRSQEKVRLQTEQAKVAQSYDEREKAFAEKTKDYRETLESVDDIVAPPIVLQVIRENGPELAYELAKNREEMIRICKLPPLAAAIEMGVLKSKVHSKASSGTETKRVSSAPAPIAGVGGGGKATAPPKSLDEAAKTSFAEYKKLREEQLKPKGRQASG